MTTEPGGAWRLDDDAHASLLQLRSFLTMTAELTGGDGLVQLSRADLAATLRIAVDLCDGLVKSATWVAGRG